MPMIRVGVMNTKYCKCGKPNDISANFCVKCGIKFADAQVSEASASQTNLADDDDGAGEGRSLQVMPIINLKEIQVEEISSDEVKGVSLNQIVAEEMAKKMAKK